ncbi:hypothetical protein PHYBLDRAFT_144618 [Phycomyces blakesleeanus NRRL 1555(-)]|uniref:Uncharacterized protein n=1 Tax=Phycomyces blakesleeanus (strain ATCC 8743b / DSM 1359 / FGSC 10004 / NBRC 33097 / NRRL 1555) TaxID=763407 RepID=A0A162XDM9_PHYB8|nr:hypothetical protein PHYBLDRAFT_144618 [Phycomyces blakesleeanus NRRL 1555(-)]OAD74165.1 hypothetical protein PHYBLDRAFT_144618 [Phycomyces blakesleeanus NRRL 1555(-)]|eukprot:XP_018292205.1 hypothetical protein PHYBLDRAFT_144618 [Phycomyces blakesleeanus NRRL 1555(-)]
MKTRSPFCWNTACMLTMDEWLDCKKMFLALMSELPLGLFDEQNIDREGRKEETIDNASASLRAGVND